MTLNDTRIKIIKKKTILSVIISFYQEIMCGKLLHIIAFLHDHPQLKEESFFFIRFFYKNNCNQ